MNQAQAFMASLAEEQQKQKAYEVDMINRLGSPLFKTTSADDLEFWHWGLSDGSIVSMPIVRGTPVVSRMTTIPSEIVQAIAIHCK